VIIDCHGHADTGEGLTGLGDIRAPLAGYLRRADAAGVTHTVLFAPFSSDYAVANREVARIVAAAPQRFVGFTLVNPARNRGRVSAMVAEAVQRHGFRGIKVHRIKVHRHDARITREVCEAARAWRLPVLYDVMGDAAPVGLIAGKYPGVPFVIPLPGSFADDRCAQTAFLDHLARIPNVFTDISGVRRFDVLVEAVRRAGPRKVLFGSDGPWLHPGVELAKVRALCLLPPSHEQLITRGNVLRLLRSAARGPRTGRAPRMRPPVPTGGPGISPAPSAEDPCIEAGSPRHA
jgi:predicted TIM-barrel fold metal-dependent hydrolase